MAINQMARMPRLLVKMYLFLFTVPAEPQPYPEPTGWIVSKKMCIVSAHENRNPIQCDFVVYLLGLGKLK